MVLLLQRSTGSWPKEAEMAETIWADVYVLELDGTIPAAYRTYYRISSVVW